MKYSLFGAAAVPLGGIANPVFAADGKIIGIVIRDTIYFKTDEASRAGFKAEMAEVTMKPQSEVMIAILEKFRKAGIAIPCPAAANAVGNL